MTTVQTNAISNRKLLSPTDIFYMSPSLRKKNGHLVNILKRLKFENVLVFPDSAFYLLFKREFI